LFRRNLVLCVEERLDVVVLWNTTRGTLEDRS